MWGRTKLTVAVAVAATVMLGTTTVPAVAGTPMCEGLTATIVGTDGDDDLHGTDGPDVVWLGPGDDDFNGRAGDDVICGGDGRDHIEGGRGDDHLYGEGGVADVLIGGPGADQIHGGPGRDSIYGEPISTNEPAGIEQPDLLFGDEGDDSFYLWSGDGTGGGGADVVDGGEGLDLLSYVTSRAGVEIDVAAGTATGDAEDTFTNMERYQGSRYGDVLIGTDGPDDLDANFAYEGTDHVLGGDGADLLSAYSGTVDAGRGRDRFVAYYASNIVVHLGPGRDQARVVPGHNARYFGGPGQDHFVVVDAEYGHDYDGLDVVVRANGGFDTLDFSDFFRAVTVDTGRHAARARNTVVHFHNVDEFFGTEYADTLLGADGRDRFHGGAGDDELRGRRGADLLIGDDGDDAAYGGAGRDTCDAERRHHC